MPTRIITAFGHQRESKGNTDHLAERKGICALPGGVARGAFAPPAQGPECRLISSVTSLSLSLSPLAM